MTSLPICKNYLVLAIAALAKVLRDALLTRASYDGEADDPAPPVKEEPIRSDPEPAPIKPEPQLDSWQPEQTQEDTPFQHEPDQAGSHDIKMETQDHDDDYDRPIGIKEDGYV